ncbi:M23 family metallopeptidase [Spirosoma sp. SC4-14]|uniref:M23 family metallopeptidase n=1 Tax=Spirosoma sp. SC4-14 TaxID=3128900 RepID=UPI0030CDF7EA
MKKYILSSNLIGLSFLASAYLFAYPASSPQRSIPNVEQGGVVRWAGDCVRCSMGNKHWRALDGNCYFPVDMAKSIGVYPVYRWNKQGHRQKRYIDVVKREFIREDFKDFPKTEYVDVSPRNIARVRREQSQVMPLFRRETKADFDLPLGAPASSMPKAENNFGAFRTFNGKPRNRHTGVDYPIAEGQPVLSLAPGRVVLVGDHFFGGKSVYVDHGDGLVAMYLHLNSFAVVKGDRVKKGQKLGEVGATGRATGPHLHLGVRWHNSRIDPSALLAAPGSLPQLQ